MRILAYHDIGGSIRSFVTFDGPANSGLMRVPDSGELVTQVDGMQVEPGEKGLERLRALAESSRVPVPVWNPKASAGK